MRLEQFKKDAYEYEGLTSGLVRQLALAGIAVIWIFKIDNPKEHLIPDECYWPLLLFVLTLVFDFLQYFILAIIWKIFFRYHEKKNNGNVEVNVKADPRFLWPSYFLFYGKAVLLAIGYIFIVKYISCKL
jgi:hypothetical protein